MARPQIWTFRDKGPCLFLELHLNHVPFRTADTAAGLVVAGETPALPFLRRGDFQFRTGVEFLGELVEALF